MTNRYEILKAKAKEKAKGATIKDYAMGIGLCAVVLNDGRSGVAYTAREMIPWGCSLYDELPKMGSSVDQFIDMFDSEDVLMRALGMATINACINQGEFEEADIMKEISIDKSDVVGMIGDFTPMVEDIKSKSAKLYIFEKERIPGTIPTEKIPDLLPECDIVMISATTLLNRTFDSILEHVKTDRIYILGPSTPICPEALPEIRAFGGTLVNEGALQTVYHGGGTRNLYREKTGKKITFVNRR